MHDARGTLCGDTRGGTASFRLVCQSLAHRRRVSASMPPHKDLARLELREDKYAVLTLPAKCGKPTNRYLWITQRVKRGFENVVMKSLSA